MRRASLQALVIVLALVNGGWAGGGEIEVVRDKWGTPHVFAASEDDGFFGVGYACAQDRILQMDLLRRRAAGRLAEVFGSDWIDADRAARIAGHTAYSARAYARLPAKLQQYLRAYAAGVNACLKAEPRSVARRFQPLGILPEPWTPADCLLAARGILALGSPFDEGSIEAYHGFRELAEKVGRREAAGQTLMVVDDEGAIVPESEMAKDKEVYARLKAMPRMPGFELRGAPAQPRKMSHAWAVGGRRSATGKPILESDPQLPLSTPPFFYEFHLAAGRIDARGIGIPGCPGLFIGFNRRIAWGATALGVDSFVTFLDRLTPDGKGYLFEDKPVPFQRRLEKIEVRGAPAVIQEVFTGRHGTVFNSLARKSRPGEAYLCYDAQSVDAGTSVRAMLEVMTAGNWGEFRKAMEHYYYPGLHVVYADADGDLGYQTVVHRPLTVRSPRRALEGWTGKEEVRGRIPLNDLPHMLNPDAGCVSHANNLPVGPWYPYDLGLATGGTGHTGRSWRLRQLLEGDRKFSVDDFERVLHRDDVDPLVAALLPVARKVAQEDKVGDADVLRLLKSLEGWDLHAGTTNRFPTARGLENTLTPYRGAGLQNVYGAGGGGVAHLARDVGAQFTRDGTTPGNPAVRAYLINWLRSATGVGGRGRGGASDERTARVTPSKAAGRRGADRSVVIPYQRTIPLNLPVVDGSLDIVSGPLACLNQGTLWSQPGNVYTQIVDLSDLDNSRSMIAPGNSEDAASPFRTSQIGLWVQGATHPSPLSREKVEPLAVSRLRLGAAAHTGHLSSPERLAAARDPAARFIPAIPPTGVSIEWGAPALDADRQAATRDLRRLYKELVAMEGARPGAVAGLPPGDDPRRTTHRDVVYGKTHPDLQRLDAYLVKSSRPTPVLVEIHGGGWRRGSKSQFVYPGNLMGAVLEAGISVISVDYRLTPQHTFPAQMADVARAVQFVRSKATAWNLDPNRVAAVGGSAGAHLSAWVALHDDLAKPASPDPVERFSSRLACFIVFAGPMDLTRVRPTELARQPLRGQDFANAFTAALGCTAEQFEQDERVRRRVREASPVFLVSPDDPPAFIAAAGAAETARVPPPPIPATINDPHSAWHGTLLADAMRRAGVEVAAHLGPDVGKAPRSDAAAIVAFLKKHLGETRPKSE